MTLNAAAPTPVATSIAPWLSVRDGAAAVEFYKAAFEATEVYRLENPGGVVSRLSIHRAEFWVAGETGGRAESGPETVGGGSVRMILTVPDPDALFARAIKAGASEVVPMDEGHGWRLGR